VDDAVFAVPVGDDWLVHAPIHGVSSLVNESALDALLSGAPGGQTQLQELARMLDVPCTLPSVRQGAARPDFLGIIPTRSCNLSCSYCGFGAASAAENAMTPAAASAAVDWMAERRHADGRADLALHFFGGEPFIAPDVVEAAVVRARLRATELGLTPYFNAVTNGVFGEAVLRLVEEHFDGVVLSLDGPAEVHDVCRHYRDGSGSFAAAAETASRLGRSGMALCLRVCVTRESLPSLRYSVDQLARRFHPGAIDLECLRPTPEAENAGLHTPDPWEFAVECAACVRIGEQLGVEVVHSPTVVTPPRTTLCPVGTDSPIVSPDGRVSACYLLQQDWQAAGLDLDLGRQQRDGQITLEPAALDRVRRLVADKPRCERCFCRWSCAGGCHVHNTHPGSPTHYIDSCIQTRILTAYGVLGRLGLVDRANHLLSDRRSMERLALQPSDLARDWSGGAATGRRGSR
jgi:uncharacterized protein